MQRIKVLGVVVILSMVALGLQTVTIAQSDTASSTGSATNQAVFVTVATPYSATPTVVTSSDVEQGFTSIGTATFNIDATVTYNVAVDSNNAGTSAPALSAFTIGKSAATACQLNLNGAGFVDGSPGPTSTGHVITTGTSGTDHTVALRIQWTQYTKAPSGTYNCEVEMTVTEAP